VKDKDGKKKFPGLQKGRRLKGKRKKEGKEGDSTDRAGKVKKIKGGGRKKPHHWIHIETKKKRLPNMGEGGKEKKPVV